MTIATLIKEKTFNWGLLRVSEVYSIIIMAGHSSVQADMVLQKDLRVLHLDPQRAGDCVPHWCSSSI